jgi:hypothetical protein
MGCKPNRLTVHRETIMNYYFYKSGAGNCCLPYLSGYKLGTKAKNLENVTVPGLYVGFNDIDSKYSI